MNLTNVSPTTDALPDSEWIKHALNSFASVEPKEKSLGYIRSREAWAHKLVSEISASRIPRLIVALFDNYDGRKEDAFSEMMWLINALYSSLPQKVSRDDACAILSATRHSCGHGGVVEPVNLARISFSDSSYTPELFRAMRTYRDRLAGISSSTATDVRGEIAIILWQDPQEPLRPGNCLSAGIRESYFAAENFRRERWGRLLRHTDNTARRRPDKKWVREAGLALNNLGTDAFAQDLAEWLKIPDGRVPLSTGGRHVLKTLIWYSALTETDRLDHLLPGLIDLQYAKPEAAVHLIYAIGYWLESRPKEFGDEHRKRLREKWPIAGSRIRG
ncbi:MAG TPA: hypothetical protein VNV43_08365 [Candidatus Acidoferrales bacterium]|nr:hypothetical protein [Candidatus Acidoferrales bacterium]